MAFFREAFTKEKKEALNYDDNAALYFGGTVLVTIIVPWAWIFFRNLFFPFKSRAARSLFAINSPGSPIKSCKCSQCTAVLNAKRRDATSFRKRLRSWSHVSQFICLGILCFSLYQLLNKLSTVSEINAFDPFEILNVTRGTDERQIRKAYRRMSLTHHPDKNPNDPFAQAKFILVTKAYHALSDETARRNYEKYGNPDGPGLMEVGIGLPQFLVDGENQGFFLALFMLIVIVGIPFGFILYYQQQKNFYPNGVRVETIQFLGCYLTETTNIKKALEFLAASAESRDMTIRESDTAAMEELVRQLGEMTKKLQFTSPLVIRNLLLLRGHMHRLRHLMTPDLRKDLDILLRIAPAITQSMIDIAFIRNWFPVIRAIVETRRCLVQALTPSASVLMEVPHYRDLTTMTKKQYGSDLLQFINAVLSENSDSSTTLAGLTSEQRVDVHEFCRSAPRLEMTHQIGVEGENEIVQNDLVTLRVTLTRLNLAPGSQAGAVHAPLFHDLKLEEWWLFVINKTTGGLMTYKRCVATTPTFTEDLRFVVFQPGRLSLEFLAICDCYSGLDITKDIRIEVYSQKDVLRKIHVHPDDEALDNTPTMFQQMLGQIDYSDDDSDLEE